MGQGPTRITPMFPIRRLSDQPRKPVPRWSVVGIFLILLSAFVIEARSFLMPVTLALLLFFVFVPVRRILARLGIRAPAAAGIITFGMLAVVGIIGLVAWGPVAQLMENAPQISSRLEQRFAEIRASMRPIEEAAAKLDQISGGGGAEAPDGAQVIENGGTTAVVAAEPASSAPGSEDITVEVKADATAAPSTMQRLMTLGPAIGGQVVFMLVLLYFMLASGDLLYLKIVQSFDSMHDKRAAYTALRDIEDALGAYLGAITMINAGLGVAIGLAMWAWGMPSPVLWGVAGFILNYIPYIGALAGTVAGALVALFVFDGLWNPAMVGLTFLVLTSLEGQFVTPYFVSRRLRLNEVVVFVTVALWAWFWSVLGMVVAVPLLVVARVLAEHIPGLEKFGNFLAGEAPPQLEEEAEEAAPEGHDQDRDQHEDEARDIIAAGDEAATAAEAEAMVGRVPAVDDPAPASNPAATGADSGTRAR